MKETLLYRPERYERAPAKINLVLDVLGRRTDGYHDLFMINQTVSLWDELFLTENAAFSISSDLPSLPSDRSNLIWRAAEVFFDAVGRPLPPFRLFVRKRIPVGAGLGGGSANAAAALRLFNRRAAEPFALTDLERLAARVGSDVPFCVRGGTQRVTGRGEQLDSAPPLRNGFLLIVKPAFALSTADMFRRVRPPFASSDGGVSMREALSSGHLTAVAGGMRNALSDCVPLEDRGSVEALRSRLLALGALNAVMTGSGSAAVGLFDRKDRARAACISFRIQGLFVRLTRPIDQMS